MTFSNFSDFNAIYVIRHNVGGQHTGGQKFEIIKAFYLFERRLNLFDQKYSKTILLWNITLKIVVFDLGCFKMKFIAVIKAEFSASLLQSLVSLQKSL